MAHTPVVPHVGGESSEQRIGQTEAVDHVHPGPGEEPEEPDRAPRCDVGPRQAGATTLGRPGMIHGVVAPPVAEPARGAVVDAAFVGHAVVAHDRVALGRERRTGGQHRVGRQERESHHRGCRDRRRTAAGRGHPQEQGHGDQQGNREEAPGHEVAADPHHVPEVQEHSDGHDEFARSPPRRRDRQPPDDQYRREGIERGRCAQVGEAPRHVLARGQTGPEFGVGRVGKRNAVVDDREDLPGDQRGRPQHHGPKRAPVAALPQQGHQQGCDQHREVQPAQEQRRDDRRDPQRRPTLRPPFPQQHHHEKVHQRVLEARRAVVDEAPRQRESAHEDHREPTALPRPADEQDHRRPRHQQRDDHAADDDLPGDRAHRGQQQHPQRVRVGLHPLGHVPTCPVAVDDVLDGAERDEGVVAQPGRRERGSGQQQQGADQSRADEGGALRYVHGGRPDQYEEKFRSASTGTPSTWAVPPGNRSSTPP